MFVHESLGASQNTSVALIIRACKPSSCGNNSTRSSLAPAGRGLPSSGQKLRGKGNADRANGFTVRDTAQRFAAGDPIVWGKRISAMSRMGGGPSGA